MKIVSHFLDYYDYVEDSYYSPGTPKVEYHRKTEQCSPAQIYRISERLSKDKVESIKLFSCDKNNWSVVFFALGFCGKLYRGVKIIMQSGTEVSYTLTGVKHLPKIHGVRMPHEVEENAKKHFDLWDDFCQDICAEIDEPIFVILPGSFYDIQIIKNPILSDWHFNKIVNCYDAFHKTKMFLVNNKSKKPNKSQSIIPWLFNPFTSSFLTAR